ncbi:MAG: response regulator [Oceanococcus sp.]
MVQQLLLDEFECVDVSIDPSLAAADFETLQPDVLVLVFQSLTAAQQYYLGLYRKDGHIHAQKHRTVVLCNKRNLAQAYELCKKDYFNDYVLFWPMPDDPHRLKMATRLALKLRPADSLQANDGPEAPQPEAPQKVEKAEKIEELESLEHVIGLQPSVLIVDDDPLQHKMLSGMLRSLNLDLSFACSEFEALELLKHIQPQLILMDINLPDGDGVDITQRIKDQPGFQNTPVIMVTGHGSKEIVLRSRQAGAVDFLVKPYQLEKLLKTVQQYLP